MCLNLGSPHHRFEEKLSQSTGTIECWKILRSRISWKWRSNRLPSQKEVQIHSPYMGGAWLTGITKSNRRSTSITRREKKQHEVDKGIHVYCSRQAAQSRLACTGDSLVVCVLVRKKDFVASDMLRKEAVFTKVRLSKSEYDRAMKHANRIWLRRSSSNE